MAFSSQRALSDGTLSDIELTIEYIDRVDLKLFVDSVQIEDTIYSYEFITDNLIRITPDVAAGEEVLIQRQTRLESVLNVYADGAVFNNSSMDENFRQMLLIAQEAREGATLEEIFNDLNMHGYNIRNLANGTLPLDAVNKQQLDGVVSAAGAAAAASAAAASASATLAQRWANENEDVPVTTGLYSAKHWSAKSEDSADAASLAADDAEAAALVAQANQVPLCGVIWWPTRAYIPGGYIAGDGTLLSRASFPSLWALVDAGSLPSVSDAVWLADPLQRGKYSTGDGSTTFRVPDYNGVQVGSLGSLFQRGSASAAGSVLRDQIQNITGSTELHGTVGVSASSVQTGAFTKGASLTNRVSGTAEAGATALAFDASLVARTGSETYPTHVTGVFIIKAFSAEIDPGAVDIAQLASDVVALTGRVQTLEASRLTTSVRQATTSGTSHLLSGVPPGTKRITVSLYGVSTNGSGGLLIQAGAGAVETTGYSSTSNRSDGGTAVSTSTSGFVVRQTGASQEASVVMTLTHLGSNMWVASHAGGSVTASLHGGGSKTLAGALDRIQLTTVTGTEVFDAGSWAIQYEG